MPLTEKKPGKKRILVCPLDWGLGHAARDVAVISRLLDLRHEVILAGDGASLDLLHVEFPELETLPFRSAVRIRYSMRMPAWMKITLLSPLLLFEVFSEHYRMRRILSNIKPDVIISDNRYGLWNRKIMSILITHQLNIRLPWFARFLEYPACLIIRAFISRFDRCWIPDYPGEKNLSGVLSHRWGIPRNAVFIGPISRFAGSAGKILGQPTNRSDVGEPATLSHRFILLSARPVDLVILLSGPEPQRSRLQKIVLKQALSLESSCVILQGLPGSYKRTDLTSKVTMYSHLPAADLGNLIKSAENVICRAGYTGIMDLALMRKKSMIIPTPGQTEQEYLADYLAGRGMFLTCSQDELDLESALEDLSDFEPELNFPGDGLLARETEKLS